MWLPSRRDALPYHNGISYDATRNPGRGGRMVVKVPGSGPKIGVLTDFFTFSGDADSVYRGANGLMVASVANTPRIQYDANGVCLGLLMEGARTNQLLWSRDQTDAAWVKVTMTAAKDQVGEDGVANSASSLTATGAAATSLQTIVQAAVDSTLSFSIKRLVGAGTIGICQDGVTFTDVTAQVNSTTYSRVLLRATQLNPVLGIRLGTSGDAVAVDFGQFEAGISASSRIPTTTAAVARATETCRRVFGAEVSQVAGTCFADIKDIGQFVTGVRRVMEITDGTANERHIVGLRAGATPIAAMFVIDGGVAGVNDLTAGSNFDEFGSGKVASVYALNNCAISSSGSVVSEDTSATMPTVTQMDLGNEFGASASALFGHIRRFDYYPERKSNAFLRRITGPIGVAA